MPLLGSGLIRSKYAFSPKSISNLQLWVDASLSSTSLDTSSGRTSVSQINDLSGNNNHPIQATKNNQPTWSTLNSKNALYFDGYSPYFLNFTSIAMTNFTVVVVARPETAGSPSTYISYGIAGNGQGIGFGGNNSSLGANLNNTLMYDGSNIRTANINFYNLNKAYSFQNQKIFINNSEVAYIDTNNLASLTLSRIGTRADNTLGLSYNGYFQSIAIYNRTLNSAELTNLYNYFSGMYTLN